MKIKLDRLDWSLVQAFLAVAETGSLSAAARQLDASQPTLGRQIKAMEAQLGAELFHRQPRGFVPTETGTALVGPAKAMRDAMREITLRAAGQQAQLDGTVRITASVATAAVHLPPIIAHIRAAEPEIAIELVASDATSNLLYREADIAVRMFRPTQLDLITQHIGDLELGIYATRGYVEAHGVPDSAAAFQSHDFVGYDQNSVIIEGFRANGVIVDRDYFKTRCDDNMTYLALVEAGCGIGFAQKSIAGRNPDLVEIDLGIPLPALPVWLTAHEVMRQTPRVRRVWEMLAEGLRPLVS